MARVGRTVRAIGVAALAAGAVACGEEATSRRIFIEALREGTAELPPTEGNTDIGGPELPACLQGDDPPGCHAAPNLPPCLQGEAPEGCASPPAFADWICPPGWRVEKVGEGEAWEHTVCSVGAPERCSAGTVDWLGDPATCEPLGTACPAATFHPEAEIRSLAPAFAGSVWYVEPGATGTGSAASPFGSLDQAVAASTDGDIVALSAGSFTATEAIAKAVAIVGACPSETVVRGAAGPTAATLTIRASGVRVANLRVEGPGSGVVVEAPSQDVTLDAVEVADATDGGVEVEAGASVIAADLVVRRIAPVAGLEKGWGVAIRGGVLSAERLLVEGTSNHGVAVLSGGELDLRDVVVRDVEALQGTGTGILVQDATATIATVLLEDNDYAGLFVQGSGGACDVDTLVARGTTGWAVQNQGGHGLVAYEGSTTTARQVLLEDNETVGLLTDATMTATGMVIRDTRPRASDQRYGAAAQIAEPARSQWNQIVVTGATEFGIDVSGEQTVWEASDLVIVDTAGRATDGLGGSALQVSAGGLAALDRAWIARNRYMSLIFVEGAVGELNDVTVLDSLGEGGTDQWGYGVWAGEDVRLTGSRATIRRAVGAGLAAAMAELLSFEHVLVDEVTGTAVDNPGDAIYGHDTRMDFAGLVIMNARRQGILFYNADGSVTDAVITHVSGEHDPRGEGGFAVVLDSNVVLERALIEDTDTRGVFLQGPGASATLTDVEVGHVRARPYDATSGGITAEHDSLVDLTRVTSHDAEAVGIYARTGSKIAMTDTLIQRSRSELEQGVGGMGVYAMRRAEVTGTRVRISDNQSAGVLLTFGQTTGTFDHLVIDRTRPPDCMGIAFGEPGSCFESPGEVGNSVSVGVGLEATASLRHFDLGHALCGIQIAADGLVSAENGTVHHNAIGANIRVPDYDLTTVLGPRVRYHDNATQLDTKDLRLPELPID